MGVAPGAGEVGHGVLINGSDAPLPLLKKTSFLKPENLEHRKVKNTPSLSLNARREFRLTPRLRAVWGRPSLLLRRGPPRPSAQRLPRRLLCALVPGC